MPESASQSIRDRLEGAFRMAARSDQRYDKRWIVPDCSVTLLKSWQGEG